MLFRISFSVVVISSLKLAEMVNELESSFSGASLYVSYVHFLHYVQVTHLTEFESITTQPTARDHETKKKRHGGRLTKRWTRRAASAHDTFSAAIKNSRNVAIFTD